MGLHKERPKTSRMHAKYTSRVTRCPRDSLEKTIFLHLSSKENSRQPLMNRLPLRAIFMLKPLIIRSNSIKEVLSSLKIWDPLTNHPVQLKIILKCASTQTNLSLRALDSNCLTLMSSSLQWLKTYKSPFRSAKLSSRIFVLQIQRWRQQTKIPAVAAQEAPVTLSQWSRSLKKNLRLKESSYSSSLRMSSKCGKSSCRNNRNKSWRN